ncbi:MAG: hypothetical protein A2X64_05650 [Ignavibacteria bacterium GWF2_33_9]|nr:MAG: hypothetical protein A2X64_05650 [Ignavibacteria bacterium GWF2_33_9]
MDEKVINQEIGERLREIRHIFNEGTKLSAEQFAHLLNETRDKIINYENGRAAVPLRVLIELYKRGINPIYLITGEGDKYARNFEGKNLKKKIDEKLNLKENTTYAGNFRKIQLSEEEKNHKHSVIKVAAGKIPKSPKDF